MVRFGARMNTTTLLLLLVVAQSLGIEIISGPGLALQDPQDFDLLFPEPPTTISKTITAATAPSVGAQKVRQAVELAISRHSNNISDFLNGWRPVSWTARNRSAVAFLAEEASRILADSLLLKPEEVALRLPALSAGVPFLVENCLPEERAPCPPLKYRSPSSYCNNVQNPQWGGPYTGFGRLLNAHYNDGISKLRESVTGNPLPGPLQIGKALRTNKKVASGYVTALTAVWAQFVLNDVSNPLSVADVGAKTQCCITESKSAECLAVVSNNGKCWQYFRSASAPRRNCGLGAREQMNGATAFLDASAIYGNTEGQENNLRTFDGGFLKTSPGDLLPFVVDEEDCGRWNNSCMRSGDDRVNDSPALMTLHTLFLREHNRVAQKLGDLNPLWDDDTIFKEAQRIVAAQIQHLTYREFLPAILGENLAENLKLTPQSVGYFNDYDSEAYPGTLQGAAAAALSFALPMLPVKFDKYNNFVNKSAESSSPPLSAEQTEDLLLALIDTMSQRTSLMVPTSQGNSTLAKVIEIILRGRDHGLPGYTTWRQFCGLNVVSNWTDLTDIISQNNIDLLSTIYSNVNDVDLYVGALAETPLKGAVVGPTFGCILAHQFALMRKSDRFWYENDVPPSSFTKEQLQEIRRTHLAGLICDNVPSVKFISPKVFHEKDNFLNTPIPCSLITGMDLDPWVSDLPTLQVPDELLKKSIERALVDIAKRHQTDLKIFNEKLGMDPKSPAGIASSFSRPNSGAIHMSNVSLLLEFASEEFLNHIEQPKFSRVKRQIRGGLLANLFGRNTRPLTQGLNNVDVTRFVPPTTPPSVCQSNEDTLPCDNTTPFRKFSGFCNNLRNPTFGRSLTPFNRLLPAAYDDGIARARFRSVTGQPLPSARLVSIMLHQDVSNLHRRYTTLITAYSQFLDHDISLTPNARGANNAVLNCRDCDSSTSVHPECLPIPIPSNDPFFPRVNAQTGRPLCMAFTRSLPGQQRLGAREQLDQNTAYLDASHVYGQTVCEAQRFRSFSGGRLNVTLSPFGGKDLLPQTNRQAECSAASGLCFEAGDFRSAENPALSTMHIAFLREHNRIAGQLQALNRNWDDERLYQMSRRITNAVWQHISYNEFIPRLLGWNAVNLYGLNLLTEGYYDGYDANCNAGLFNEFAGAAYRFGHSLVRPMFPRVDANFQEKTPIQLRTSFFNSETLMEFQAVDEVIRGLFVTPMENLDQFVSNEVTNHLFESRRVAFSGFDLAALNIQRGRDHGLRAYNEYRAACNLKRAINFEDLSREMTPEIITRLRQVYVSVDDIDLWSGGLVETPLQGGLVGPTFACILGNQFRSLRRCDRFWYENNNQAGKFTEAQLAEIRKVTLSRLICENSDSIGEITRSVFDLPHNFLNPRVPCRSLPLMDLTPWKDQDTTCVVLGKNIAIGASSLVSPCTSCTCTAEGPQCQSLRVNCQQLLTEVGRDAVLADNVCRVQCAFLFPPGTVAPGAAPAPAAAAAPAPAPVAPAAPAVQRPQRPRGGRLLPNLFNIFG